MACAYVWVYVCMYVWLFSACSANVLMLVLRREETKCGLCVCVVLCMYVCMYIYVVVFLREET